MDIRSHETDANSDMIGEVTRVLAERFDQQTIQELASVIELAVEAHAGHDGLDGRPLVLHCADVASSAHLSTDEERQLGLLHDAATSVYSNFTPAEFIEKARAIGCSKAIIIAALCFARPPDPWEYDDWVSFLMRHDLTRLVKLADSEAAIARFPPASEGQFAAWQRTRDRLAENAREPSEVTRRITHSMSVYPLPELDA